MRLPLVLLSVIIVACATKPAVKPMEVVIEGPTLYPADRGLASVPCAKQAGERPYPDLPAGTNNTNIPIEHIIVVMQENRSFDTYFGRLNQPQFYGKQIDGLDLRATLPDSNGNPVKIRKETNLCISDTNHEWVDMHSSWNGGRNDGFVRGNGAKVMAYYDHTDLPFYYAVANQFATGDRFFSSVIGPTYPNRYFLYAGTAFGHTDNIPPKDFGQWKQKTIFDSLDEHKITWKYYADWKYHMYTPGYISLFHTIQSKGADKFGEMRAYYEDLAANKLPQVVFLDAQADDEDEHPDANIQAGQAWMASVIGGLMESKAWKKAALFLVYDEGGNFYDHVPPPSACAPDALLPAKAEDGAIGGFTRYGFRVPFLAISPYVKRHHVSHVTYDHTSILKFIEYKYNLPYLTARDANADGLMDMFQFKKPNFTIPRLPAAVIEPTRNCKPKTS